VIILMMIENCDSDDCGYLDSDDDESNEDDDDSISTQLFDNFLKM